MHAEGKPHGNIQPKNLLVTDGDKIDISSFEKEKVGIMDRTSSYSPPEAYGDPPPGPTIAGDIYALAAVLYHAICGQPPIRASTRNEKKIEKLQMEIKPGIAVATALERGLALNCDDRPKEVSEFCALLEPSTLSTTESPSTPDKCTVEKMKQAHAGEFQPATKELAVVVRPTASSQRSTTAPMPSSVARIVAPAPAALNIKLVERLPVNLTVGKSFEFKIADLFKGPRGSLKIEFVNADELGFLHNKEKDFLTGTPKRSGELKLQIELIKVEVDGRRIFDKSIAVTVNPDPDSLWKNKDSNKDDRYWKDDTAHLDVSTPHGRILAASQRGRSHAHEGLFRDDDFSISYHEPTGWHLLAAADGAGSAKYSRKGSLIACTESLRYMRQWIESQQTSLEAAVQSLLEKEDDRPMRTVAYSWLGGGAFEARMAIESEAKSQEQPAVMRDYATTLLLAVAKHTRAGWIVATFTIGDGGVGILQKDGQVKALCTPDSGEFSGQTVFLTASNVMGTAEQIMQRIHTARMSDVAALVLMTDGVTDPKFPTESSLSDPTVWNAFWTELNATVNLSLENMEASAQLLNWLSFRSPGNHDDRTIVLLLPISKRDFSEQDLSDMRMKRTASSNRGS
jgi:hypothetical protein